MSLRARRFSEERSLTIKVEEGRCGCRSEEWKSRICSISTPKLRRAEDICLAKSYSLFLLNNSENEILMTVSVSLTEKRIQD